MFNAICQLSVFVPLGCAFLKFPSRMQAQNAIGEMHNSTTMEVCHNLFLLPFHSLLCS